MARWSWREVDGRSLAVASGAPSNVSLLAMRTRHVPRLLVALVAAVVLAVSIGNDATAQQPGEFFEVAVIEHDPSGRIVASLAVPQTITLDPTRLTVFVDGLRQPIESVSQRDPVPISVVIAIDTSGSMDGTPIVAAREAAQGLVDRLNVDDEVAVVSFADQPRVLSDFTTDRSETLATIRSVTALGATALYGAVGESAALIAQADTETRVLVLLSDGVDSGVSAIVA